MSKPDYDKALYRLTTIISRLLTGEALTVKELAEDFNVSARTIQKDLNERLAHFDLMRDDFGRYMMHDPKSLYDGFSTIDYMTKDLMFNFIGGLEDKFHDSSLKILKQKPRNSIIATNYMAENLGDHSRKTVLIYQSIKFEQSLRFNYVKRDGEEKTYDVDPYKLCLFDGFWYLLSWDRDEKKVKSFYIKNMKKIQTSPENFLFDDSISKEIEDKLNRVKSPWFEEKQKQAQLRICNEAMKYLQRNLPHNIEITSENDGYFNCDFYYYADVELLSFIKKWLPDVKLINPEDKICNTLKAELEDYINSL